MKKSPEQMGESVETAEQTGESPTIKSILGGEAEISPVGEESFSQEREIDGRRWSGKSYQYELTVPHPTKPEEKWTTYLTVWSPSTIHKNEPYTRIPETQIFISTGKGDMPLYSNPETIKRVLEEIKRQVRGQK